MDHDGGTVALTHLEPGEALLWSGRPRRAFDRRELRQVPVPAFLVVFSAFATVGLVRQEGLNSAGGVIALLIGLGMLGIGLALVLAVLVTGPRGRAHRTYAVTDRRVLIVSRWLRERVDAYPLRGMAVSNVLLEERADGLGKIGFADFAKRCGYDKQEICMPVFELIADAAAVAELIRNGIRRASPR